MTQSNFMYSASNAETETIIPTQETTQPNKMAVNFDNTTTYKRHVTAHKAFPNKQGLKITPNKLLTSKVK